MEHSDDSKVMILTHGLYPVPGYTVSGNGIRAWGLAMGLMNKGFEVIYATPSDTVHPHTPRSEVTLAPYADKAELHQLIKLHNPKVLIIGYWAYMHLIPSDIKIPLVMDLLAPWLLEADFQETYDMEIESIDYIKCLSRADYFLCCTQRQKAFHTAWLFMSGFSSKNNILDVIPISANPNLPVRPESVSSQNSKKTVFLYGGVLWPWRSPEKWISTLLEILVNKKSGELQLITGKYPLHEASSSSSLQLPRGEQYDAVLKKSDLLPYDEMEKLYLQADIGIELSDRNTEREFSFSFRVIEYLRCGLPVICNDFLEVAELIRYYDAGWVIDATDSKAFETIVKRILSGDEDINLKRINARRLICEKFNFMQTIEPLSTFCSHPIKQEKNNNFLLSLVRHDNNVHELQTKLNALSDTLSHKDTLLKIHQERIEQFEVQLAHINCAHTTALALHENTQSILYSKLEETKTQLAVWQNIAEERRLSVRLKRLKNAIFKRFEESVKFIRNYLKKNDIETEAILREHETCLFKAVEKSLRLNLSGLFRYLELQPISELLKTGQLPFDYQQQAIDRFLSHIDVNGKNILEIGADDAVVLSQFQERGMAFGLGINNWYWHDKNPKTIKVSDKIILSWGDIRNLPIESESFDIIFTVAAFEHIHELDVAIKEMYRLLKPGGMVYSFYGPVWSCSEGHHLWFERDGKWYRFSEPETTQPILNNYEHLLLERHEMADKLRQKWDNASVNDFIYQIYDSEHINRYMYSDYIKIFNESEFEVIKIQSNGAIEITPEVKERLELKYGKDNDFTCGVMEVILHKKETLPMQIDDHYHAGVYRESDQEAIDDHDNNGDKNQNDRIGNRILKQTYKVFDFTKLLYRALVKRFFIPLWNRRGKNNLAIITRDDLFPVDHGAAAKIYHTARVLSFDYDEVYLITLDKEKFYIFRHGKIYEEVYPRLFRDMFYPTEGFLREKLTANGIPNKESFLFFPMFDNNFKLRVIYVALQKSISVYQAEFPSFIDACSWALKIFGGKSSIVEHNIEFHRIADTYQLNDDIRNYMKNYEVRLCNSVDHVITVSHNDTNGLIAAGVVKEKITMIPHGVDLENFDINAKDRSYIRSKYGIALDEILLIFHGIYSYAPNGEAAKLIGSTILPALNAKGYYPKCLAVGKYPPEESNHPDLIYTDVVEHVAPYIGAADIAVVPLQDGGGTRMKILEYFAGAIPVVATLKGAEGIEVSNFKEILIEDDMDKFIDSIIQLINDTDMRRKIGLAGRNFVEQLDWRKIGKHYVDLYSRN